MSPKTAPPRPMNNPRNMNIRAAWRSLIPIAFSILDAIDAYELALHMATSTGILKELHNGNTPEERSKYENLEELLKLLREEGVEVIGEIEEYEYGKFGWIMDPEGNKIELWEPVDEKLT